MLWLRLTPEERRKFLKVIDNPESELAKQLLASEQLEKEIREPWWDSPAPPEEHGQVDHKTGHKFGTKPGSMSIPKSLVKDTLAGPSLVFNMAAIWYEFCITNIHSAQLIAALPTPLPLGNWRGPRCLPYQRCLWIDKRHKRLLANWFHF